MINAAIVRNVFGTLYGALFSLAALAQEVTVFRAGEDGYSSYRIPAIVMNKSGELIAFAEGRVDHAGDFGNVDIVYKTSKDGRTWGKLQVAVDYNDLQAGNAAPVVDLLDPRYPDGRIFLFYNTGNDHEQSVRKGHGVREVWYVTSVDGGRSWSQPFNITAQVHRPRQPQINPEYNFVDDWRTYANTPGHGFQFISGPNKGRIYIAANHSQGDPKNDNTDWNAHAFYSDDHGETFTLSENVPYPGTNESQAAQVADNIVYMTSRNQRMNPRQRVISISKDGGHSWVSSAPDPNLPDPVNQGSVLSWMVDGKFILAHLNAANETNRDNLTLRLSENGGKTWFYNKLITRSVPGYDGAHSAYSDMVLLTRGSIGIVYEKDNYKEIVFLQHNIQ